MNVLAAMFGITDTIGWMVLTKKSATKESASILTRDSKCNNYDQPSKDITWHDTK
jgi:hypothetical protein